ncbi:MAG: PIN domain protein [candidate division KSB1 bacterium]|nr:PIN domain protein [candidate division KSB1 bacterium]
MKLRVYADTSVLGGCFDEEFMTPSKALIEEFKRGYKILLVSDLTLKEIEEAPRKIQDILQSIPTDFKEFVILDDESKLLAQKYIDEEVISNKLLVDAQHIAIATVNRADVLVSWNFRHIVNLRKIRLYNSVNLKYGYSVIEIRSPLEVIDEL